MKTMFLFLSVLAATSASADESLRVGTMLNQIRVHGDRLYVIDSGNVGQGVPSSIGTIDARGFRLIQQTKLPSHLNLYRAAVQSNAFWVSAWATGELFKLSTTGDLLRDTISPQVFYRSASGDTGLETVLRVKNRTWIAYSNLKSGNRHDPGKIVVLDEVGGQAAVAQTFITEVVNPKNMMAADPWVFVATGEYNRDDGQVVAIDTGKAPMNNGAIRLSSAARSDFYRVFKTGGTPGDMAFDPSTQKLFVCDLEAETNRLWIIDLRTGGVQAVSGAFDTCGALLFRQGKLYVTNFLGGDLGLNPNHLFMLDAATGRQICAKTLKPGPLTKPALIFPNDLEVFQQSLFVSYGGYPYVSKLNLDANGRPEGCL